MSKKKTKRVMSPEARKRISDAQKKRWEKTKVLPTTIETSPIYRVRKFIDAFKFLNERIRIYSSSVEAYVDGFVDGYNEAKS